MSGVSTTTAKKRKRRRRRRSETDERIRQAVRQAWQRQAVEVAGVVLVQFIKWSAAVAIAWAFAWSWARTAPEVAGKETRIQVALTGLLKVFANQWVYLLVAGLCGGGWAVERRVLRKRLTKMAEEIKRLEELLDTDRSTSGMKSDGTSPED